MGLNIQPIWFDSMGAKSSCTLVSTPDISVLIDPGIAVMQPSFPASNRKKASWLMQGKTAIDKASEKAEIIMISHYHHDHYFSDDMKIYQGKTIFLKNPNEYINDSQRKRAEKFFEQILQTYYYTLQEILQQQKRKKYPDPLNELPLAEKKDFKTYTKRRNELLEKGRQWFYKKVDTWNTYPQIPEIKQKDITLLFPEKKTVTFKNTSLRCTKPLFHGIEFSRVGWIYATIIEHKGKKLMHTSDMNGPIIEDYAEMIIKENPDILILDGPMTYMYGYLLNKTNLTRTIENAVRIVSEIDAELIIYDHHLPREQKYKGRTQRVWETAKREHKNVITAAEFFGETPVVEGRLD